jgi:hypothetical protein
LEIMQRMPAKVVAEAGEDFDEGVIEDMLRLTAFYRLSNWSLDSPSGASL